MFVNLYIDQNLIGMVRELKKKTVNEKLRYVVVVGIGGSNLGTKAVYDAMFGAFDLLEPERFPKMIFLEHQRSAVPGKIHLLIKTTLLLRKKCGSSSANRINNRNRCQLGNTCRGGYPKNSAWMTWGKEP
ncbi:MAG: hypothetical protein U0519_03740 [Candidatus Gracilibacteria bacterium]